MATINKKIWPDMFEIDQRNTLDFRCADFEANPGDTIVFREWDPKTREYTGREYSKTVKQALKCNSPNRYWTPEQLNEHGMYLFEWEE